MSAQQQQQQQQVQTSISGPSQGLQENLLNTQFGSPEAAPVAGLSVGTTSSGGGAIAGNLTEFNPRIDRLSHLMYQPKPGSAGAALCLFQRTGDCCGTLTEGICDSHWNMLNISIQQVSSKIWSDGKRKIIRLRTPCALEPGDVNASPALLRVFPFLEAGDFNPSDFIIGYYYKTMKESYRSALQRMAEEFSKIYLNEDNEVKNHVTLWVNYMSTAINRQVSVKDSWGGTVSSFSQSRQLPRFCLVTQNASVMFLNINKCSLVTQSLLTVPWPQTIKRGNTIWDAMSAPSNFQIIDAYFCLNTSLIPHGTDEEKRAIGTTIRTTTMQSNPYITDSLTDTVQQTVKYKLKASC